MARLVWLITLVIGCLGSTVSFGQSSDSSRLLEKSISGFPAIDQPPRPQYDFKTYIKKNLKYPDAARKSGIKGKVWVSCLILENGSVAEVKIIKGLGYGCDEEAIRLITQMPAWSQGRHDNNPIIVPFKIPVTFPSE